MLTIDTLVSNGIPVTYKNIHEKSKELDVTGKGIHANTIKEMRNCMLITNNIVRLLK